MTVGVRCHAPLGRAVVVLCAGLCGFGCEIEVSGLAGNPDATTVMSDGSLGGSSAGDGVADSLGETGVLDDAATEASSSSSSGGSGDGYDSAASTCAHVCSGCCDTNGLCQGGLDPTQCGTGGEPCANCVSQMCSGGACTPPDDSGSSGGSTDAGSCVSSSCPVCTFGSPCCTPSGGCSCSLLYLPVCSTSN
jgi:hypothetical protein